jgi:hypothetical protein
MSRRPASVTAANLALLVAAGAIATDSVIGLVLAEPVTDAFQQAYAPVAGAEFSVLSIRTTGAILLIAAGGLVVLAGLNHRGSRTAQINTWVLGALVLCWGGSSLTGERRAPRGAPDPAELERLLAAAVPGWVDPVTTGTSLSAMVAVTVAMLLLALPASNEFFRRAGPPGPPRLAASDRPPG